MMGMRPIVEMMTWNFSFQAVDQIIQNAAKLRYFSAGQAGVPMVIRGPNGGGVQLSGAAHPQPGRVLRALPRLKVVSPVTPHDAKGMMLTAIREPNPVIFLEAGRSTAPKARCRRVRCWCPSARRASPARGTTSRWSVTDAR